MSSRRQMLEFLSLSRLPAEFQEVEYLESSGTQYIDTGVIPNLNTKIVAKYNYGLSVNATQMLFGCKNTSSNYYQVYKGDSNLGGFAFGIDVIAEQNQETITSYYNLDVLLSIDKNGFSINNTNYIWNTTPYSNGYTSLSIFARHNPNDYSLFGSFKLFSFQIYDNNILVRDFVPCYRKADNVAGLYDLVNGVFYTNAGTGTFIVGGNV